jgi:tetratricopeptide (TPR) repeat protein
MSDQGKKPDETGSQESRFYPETHIDADSIAATNVVSGVQYNTYNYQQAQKYLTPLHRPRRAEHFQNRVTERSWLLTHLQPGQIVTLCGPGGMGKTALVAEILWTLAPFDSPPALFPHGLVFHSFYGQPETTVALEQLARTFGEDPLPTPKQAAQRALSGKHVLLVLDGAEEAENLEQVLAVCASCAVLVTSRRRSDAADPALLLDLQRLPQDEAVAVVQAWQAQRQADNQVIEQIVQLVGGLPLALRLAGSYLALHPDEGEEYLAWLKEDLLGALDQGSSAHKSVPILLERSVARLRPQAQAVLRLVGLLALAPFTRELVAGVLELAPAAAWRALEEVMDYGLLVHVGASYEVSHPLIHTYARQARLSGEEATQQAALVARLVRVLTEHFPEVDYANWEMCERLVPHIEAVAVQLEQQNTAQAEAAALFEQAGFYLHERARYEQAALLLQQALAIREQQVGPDHPDTASSLNRLGELYWAQGKYAEAELLLQRALVICEQQLGTSHPFTATSLNNLAALYRAQGNYAEAEPLLQRALVICEQQLGPAHPNTAGSLNNLALLYREQGKYAEAEPLYQRALAIREQQVGPMHPNTASTLHNLASLYRVQGRYPETEPLLQRALAIREHELGANHPDTARSLKDLASLYRVQGKYAEAEPLYQRALAIHEQQLGPDHPDTASSLNNLAELYRDQGKYAEAEPLFQRALEIREQQLGPNHPRTATSLHNLALLYRDQGKYAEAEPLLQRALAIREQQLGPEHPDTATTLENYALLLRRMHRSNEAVPLEQRARAIRAKRQDS